MSSSHKHEDPVDAAGSGSTKSMCYRDCPVCLSVTSESRCGSPQSVEYDPLALSNTSQNIIDLGKVNPWRTICGQYISLGFYTYRASSDVTPLGMSKFAHAGDGSMDLVLVRKVDRRNFARFLRRHGNLKDQCDLPFVESYKVKAVRIKTLSNADAATKHQTEQGGVSRSAVTFGDLPSRGFDKNRGAKMRSSYGQAAAGGLETIRDDEDPGAAGAEQPIPVPDLAAGPRKPEKKPSRVERGSGGFASASTSQLDDMRSGVRWSATWVLDERSHELVTDIGVRVHPHLICAFGCGVTKEVMEATPTTLTWVPIL